MAHTLTIQFTMRQTTIKSIFDRAYSSHMEEKQKIAAPVQSGRRDKDIPLFYIALGLSVCVYLGLLVIAPSKAHYDDWFPTIHNPNMHQSLTVASQGSASDIHH